MALEPSAAQLSVSPSSSGRASPISKKWTRRGADEPIIKDKAFRRFASGVDRSLSLFDSALQDWADYISFLGRLLKSLQSHPSTVAVIPSKGLVARRLAQCLNPALPAGVHQKALEVYSYIFSMIGKDALSRDLPLYLPGLSSTLAFASLTVRSPFLLLLETHLLNLDPSALRPALKAIILALLPGLEEETSEDFEQTLKLLNGFKLAVRSKSRESYEEKQNSGDEFFWQCFFLATITSKSRRLGALAYLTRFLPKLGTTLRPDSIDSNVKDREKHGSDTLSDHIADVVTSPEPGLLLRCFAAGLGDEQLLIQRGYLDLLVTHLPLHARVLQTRVKPEDLELLLAAASGVVARRDMSLNRRLWTWLMGPEPTSNNDGDGGPESPLSTAGDPMNSMTTSRTRYFEAFGLQPLTRAILKMILQEHTTPSSTSKPFRICLSLMDRWEVGGLVVPEIFLPVVNSVRKYQTRASKSEFNEVLRSASVFFDGVESGLIWGEIVAQIVQAIGPARASTGIISALDKMSLVQFIIANFNVREEEMLVIHAPLSALTIFAMIAEAEANRTPDLPDNGLDVISDPAIQLGLGLIELIPDRAFVEGPSLIGPSTSRGKLPSSTDLNTSDVLKSIRNFYVHDQGNLDIAAPPFTGMEMCELLHREAGRIVSQSLESPISSADITAKTGPLVALLLKSPKASSLDVETLLRSIHTKLLSSSRLPFAVFASVISLLTTLYPRYIALEQFSDLVDPLVRLAWTYLSASNPKYHVEAVRGLWQVQNALSLTNHEIEASICRLITENDVSGTFASRDANPGRSFAILWTHTLQDHAGHLDRRGSKATLSEPKLTLQLAGIGAYEVMLGRPLFLLLDALLDERTQLFIAVRTWLQSLTAVDMFFRLFIAKFSNFVFLQKQLLDDVGGDTTELEYTEEDDLDQCLYYMQKLSSVLRWSSDATWVALSESRVTVDESHQALHMIVGAEGEISLQEIFVHICLRALSGRYDSKNPQLRSRISSLHRTALSVLHQILLNPYSGPIAELHLEDQLIRHLETSLQGPDPFIQLALLDVVFASLKLRAMILRKVSLAAPSSAGNIAVPSQDYKPGSNLSVEVEQSADQTQKYPSPPVALVKCLQAGFEAASSRPVLDSWVSFLAECLPFYSDTIFQVLIPLVETFCMQIGQTFENLQTTFKRTDTLNNREAAPESTLISLLNGLEHVLARGHERLLHDEARTPALKSPDQPQGFFGNMVSGVFSSDAPQTRSQNANNRLTVLLSFQDAVRICFTIWSWDGRGLKGITQDVESAASFNYTSLRMRNRARRLLEHLFEAEALECLETVIEIWRNASVGNNDTKNSAVFNLLHVLDGSRPKHTIPAIFDAIYSRTNPGALEAPRKSTLTTELLDTDLVVFLVEYAQSLEDDTMDEIWTDCMAFLKDILGNPFPHRQTLPSLLQFAAVLGEKADNTNFGEQRKMRRELGDLFLRLLTATFTTRPIGFSDSAPQSAAEKISEVDAARQSNRVEDVVSILASIAPNLPKILVEPDRVLSATNTLSGSVIGPTFKSRLYPENVSKSLLVLLYQMTRLPNTQKSWKKDLGDAFNDPRFFSHSLSLVESDWLPLLRQWVISDKDRMPELLSRLTPPTTAGIVFGVGATSARLEADRKTQLNLRRIAVLVLAAPDDTFVTDLVSLEEKLVELLSATTTSSPSSTTRAEIYMVLRALVLKTSPIHLAFLWPTINAELYTAISSVVSADHSQSADTYNNLSVLQACKLLDTLLCIAPDDFQLHEWLFITDTIDAVYRPENYSPIGLIDQLSEELGSTAIATTPHMEQQYSGSGGMDKSVRRPLLGPGGINCNGIGLDRRDELVGKVLRPFFSQLSIFDFETTYEMGPTDWQACRKSLMADLFDEKSIIKAF